MTTELTGAGKRLKECDFEWTSERWRGGYRVELRAKFFAAAPELLAENERLRARVAELEAMIKA